jgi:hypothetical protein
MVKSLTASMSRSFMSVSVDLLGSNFFFVIVSSLLFRKAFVIDATKKAAPFAWTRLCF